MSPALRAKEPPLGVLIGYCIVSRCNRMFIKILTSRISAFFKQKFLSSFLTFIVINQVFLASGIKKPSLGFDKFLKFFFLAWNRFQVFL